MAARARAGVKDAWAVLDLQRPGELEDPMTVEEVRQAFREIAKRVHPDAEGGSSEAFRDAVDAYNTVLKEVAEGGGGELDEYEQGKVDDDFVKAWEERYRTELGAWHSFAAIEDINDDDEWGGREALGSYYVKRHDATIAGGIWEDDIAIYRLSENVDGKYWGVARVLAVQVKYSAMGPNGIVHLQPLMHGSYDDSPGRGEPLVLVDDWEAEVAQVPAIDRLEVLREGVSYEETDGTVRVIGPAKRRILCPSEVHLLPWTDGLSY